MAARNKARKRAFQILFEADQRDAEVQTVLADWLRHARTDPRQPPVSEYTMQLVEGYAGNAARIDELIVHLRRRLDARPDARSWTGASCGSACTS